MQTDEEERLEWIRGFIEPGVFDEVFGIQEAKIGSTVRIRLPQNYTVYDAMIPLIFESEPEEDTAPSEILPTEEPTPTISEADRMWHAVVAAARDS